jgi:PAS domain S-box-containing protein
MERAARATRRSIHDRQVDVKHPIIEEMVPERRAPAGGSERPTLTIRPASNGNADPTAVLAAAMAAAHDAVIAASPAGRIVLYNHAAERLLGHSEHEAVGLPLAQLFPEGLDEVWSARSPSSSTGSPGWSDVTVTASSKLGRRVPAIARVVPVDTAEGRSLVLILRDRSEEMRIDAELALLKSTAIAIGASEDLDRALELTLDQIGNFTGWTAGESWLPDGTGAKLRRGPVWSLEEVLLQEFHEASATITFRRSQGLPGRSWASGTPEWIEDVSADPGFVRKQLAVAAGLRGGFAIPVLAGPSVVAVLVFYHTDARPQDRALVDLVAAVAAQLGTLIQRKRAEAEVLWHAEELARSHAELEQFAYVASHDLQEPLRMVASYTQILERRYRDQLDDDAEEFIDYTVEGVRRMQHLILDLLSYSRVQKGTDPQERVELEEILERVVERVHSLDHAGDPLVTWDPLPRLAVDPIQISQLFENLIENAMKFRRDEPPRVHISASRRGEEWVFSCQDNGIGIGEEYFERIFAIFQRLHSRAEYPGNGIGLAICKKIVERHGGQIWVESEPGSGSRFWFSLPGGSDEDTP